MVVALIRLDVVRVPGNLAHSLDVRRHGKDECVVFIACFELRQVVHNHFVRHGAERRNHPRAAHVNAVIGFLHDTQVHARLFGRLLRAVVLRRDKCMAQEQVVVTDVLVVLHDVVRELLAALREVMACFPAEGQQRDVHEVGRAAHQAEVRFSPDAIGLATLTEVRSRLRRHECKASTFTCFRHDIRHLVLQFRVMLRVVERSKLLDSPFECRVSRDVVDALAAYPYVAGTLLQTFDELFASSDTHDSSPKFATARQTRGAFDSANIIAMPAIHP